MTHSSADPIRVFLVERNPIVRIGIRAVLADSAVRLVGEAPDAGTCLEGIGDARPDVVLLDLDLPGGSGLDTVRALAHRSPPLGILVTGWARGGWDELVLAALCAGAKGFLLKDAEPTMVLDAIRLVRGGGVAFSPGVEYALSALRGPSAQVRRQGAFPALTAREYDVLRLVARGFDNRRIARELTLSDKTVRNYVSAVLGKLGVGSRGEAIVAALSAGLTGTGDRSPARSPLASRPGRFPEGFRMFDARPRWPAVLPGAQ
ncbi:Transcriptional activator protein ExaE [Streptomyces sp. YIM 121038]|uniref:LuxR C-terminal-related transcriptional regulator n=1 Tax=Streptomyces sp. YIM 121038 TaxID=2136401 RepID=UPI00116555A4|nr:response regulator transcription factor [Streptomyces sp. YIM 121038]QCX80865.1 Transcriptional activator protein ExaE [Streptomyces sp. YIM 121038]